MKTKYTLSCGNMSIDLLKDSEGGVETVSNLVSGYEITRFED